MSFNVAFSTYAIPMVQGEIKRYIRDNNNVKISRQIKDLSYKILKYKEEYILKHNCEPTQKEICDYFNESQYKIDEALKSLNCVISLQDSINNDDNDELTYLDQISDEYDFEENFINNNTLKQAISKLEKFQKEIIIKRYIRDNNNVKISRQIKDLSYKILKFKEEYILKNSKEPTLKEICDYFNESQYKIDEALKSLTCVISLQDSINNDDNDDLTYLDQISDEYNFEENFINNNTLKQGISKLDKFQKEIIIKRYYTGLTQEEIANELFISQAQVSRLEKNAINNLKKYFN